LGINAMIEVEDISVRNDGAQAFGPLSHNRQMKRISAKVNRRK
jgi:hypothetical protein